MERGCNGVQRGCDQILGPTSGSSNISLVVLAEGEKAKGATGVERGMERGVQRGCGQILKILCMKCL